MYERIYTKIYEWYTNVYRRCFAGNYVELKYCPAGIYMLKVNKGNTRTIYEICLKLKNKDPERRQRHSWDFIILVFPVLNLNK